LRRITRNLSLKRRRVEIDTAFTGSNEPEDIEFVGQNNETTETNSADISLSDLASLIKTLTDTISNQNQTILEVKTQNAYLQDEIKSIRTQLDQYSLSPPSRSWASVVAGSNDTQPNGTSLGQDTNASTRKSNKESNCIRISTRSQSNQSGDNNPGFTRYLPTDTANTHIRNALLNVDATKDAQVVGVGTTKTGYIIRFTDDQSANKARNNVDWLGELGNGTKLVKPRFGVVAHRTPTEAVDTQDGKGNSIKEIMNENGLAAKGFKIDDIAWLISKDKMLGRNASLGVWFDTKEAADWAVDNGLVFGQRYVGSVERYQAKKKRCHRCQRVGHLAWSCKEASRCGHCAGDHERRDCPPGSTAKCLECNEQHPTGYRQCKGTPPSTQS
jgi:hypothetical protein